MSKQHHQLKWKVCKGSSVQTSHLQRILSLNPELFWFRGWGQQPVKDGNGAIFISSDTGIRGMEWWENNTSTTSLSSPREGTVVDMGVPSRSLQWRKVVILFWLQTEQISCVKSPVSNLFWDKLCLSQTLFVSKFSYWVHQIVVDFIEQKE